MNRTECRDDGNNGRLGENEHGTSCVDGHVRGERRQCGDEESEGIVAENYICGANVGANGNAIPEEGCTMEIEADFAAVSGAINGELKDPVRRLSGTDVDGGSCSHAEDKENGASPECTQNGMEETDGT